MSVFKANILDGQVALVTGGGSGIGETIAATLAAHGAHVGICGRKQDRLDQAIERIAQTNNHQGGSLFGIAADVRDPDAIQKAVDATIERFGRLSILINSAAGNFLAPAATLSPNGFGTVVDIDLKGTFNACKAVFPHFRNQNGGNIVNISATLQYLGTQMQIHASSAKAGVDALTRTLAVEWGPANIRVNAVAPGPIDDTAGMAKLAPKGMKDKLTAKIPLKRFGKRQEIADTVLFLVSPASSYTSGAIFVVDGAQWLAMNTYV